MNRRLYIFVDTDAFVALAVTNDTNHEKAIALVNALQQRPVIFFTSNYVFAESITVISQRASHEAALQYIDTMQSPENPFTIERAGDDIEDAAIRRFKQQTSKNISYVDCTNMAFMEHLQADAIFSFDSGYRKNRLTLVSDLLARNTPSEHKAPEEKAA
jgi:predicted nucleic acid-binding protein